MKLFSKNLYFRELNIKDVSEKYINWLNNKEINKFLEVRHVVNTVKTCEEFIRKTNNDPAQHLFGIFINDNDEHIGNIKLGFVNTYHKRAELSLFIGEKKYWGKSYASESIKTITIWGFKSLGLQKIGAGCNEKNEASRKAFMNCGYQVEGFFRSHGVIDGERTGCYWLGIVPGELK